MPEQHPRRPTNAVPGGIVPPVALALIAIALATPIVWELARSIARFDASIGEIYLSGSRLRLLVRSIAVAALIALPGVALGIPLARLLVARLTRRSALLAAMFISPIWLPPYMIYAAGNLVRAPDTIVGRALIELATSSPDRRWMTIWAGYAVAVVGLAVWSAPIAGVLIAAGIGFRSNLYDDMLALEPLGPLGQARFWLRMHARPLLRAWVLIGVIMFGSAVPMHLAQLDTWSIVIWRQLAEHSPDDWGVVWAGSLPPILVGLLGAWMLTRAVTGSREQTDPGVARPRLPRTMLVLALLVWLLGAIVPLLAMLISLDDPRAITQFWRLEAEALRDSGLLALATGAVALGVGLLTAFTLGHPASGVRRLGAASVLLLCMLGLIPGVLVGAAVARIGFFGLDAGWSAAWLASCIRCAFLGSIVGALCAGSETEDRRAARHQIAGGSVRGWTLTALPVFATPMLGVLLISALYALQEIEAAVMVRPPGMANLPQQLLSDLHFARLEQLSAAGVNLLLIGILVSLMGSLLLTRVIRIPRGGN